MKKLLLFVSMVCLSPVSHAADLIVEEFGTFPTYPNITDAVAAAGNGDRIIIKNRAGNIPWIENVTIGKSLQLLSYANDTFFVVQGIYTILDSAGREVSIIGMKNLSGDIKYSASASGTKTTTVNVMNCHLLSGLVNFPNNAYIVNLVLSQLDDGYINLRFGSVIGNQITYSGSYAAVTVNTSGSFANDTIPVIGNKLELTATSANYVVYWTSTASIFIIRNNLIRHRYMGIFINGCAASPGKQNLIYSNTIQSMSSGFSNYGIDIANTPAGSIVEVMNNVIDANGGNYAGIYKDSGNNGQLDVYYNHADNVFSNPISSGWTFAGNNTVNQPVTLQADGRLGSGNAAIDGGNPDPVYSDLDLSAGDAGAYGGSFTLDNFFPQFAGSARVYLLINPFNVRVGSTLNIKAYSFDR